jgi:hypothetical protein
MKIIRHKGTRTPRKKTSGMVGGVWYMFLQKIQTQRKMNNEINAREGGDTPTHHEKVVVN